MTLSIQPLYVLLARKTQEQRLCKWFHQLFQPSLIPSTIIHNCFWKPPLHNTHGFKRSNHFNKLRCFMLPILFHICPFIYFQKRPFLFVRGCLEICFSFPSCFYFAYFSRGNLILIFLLDHFYTHCLFCLRSFY